MVYNAWLAQVSTSANYVMFLSDVGSIMSIKKFAIPAD